jgi:hypothetical protein
MGVFEPPLDVRRQTCWPPKTIRLFFERFRVVMTIIMGKGLHA